MTGFYSEWDWVDTGSHPGRTGGIYYDTFPGTWYLTYNGGTFQGVVFPPDTIPDNVGVKLHPINESGIFVPSDYFKFTVLPDIIGSDHSGIYSPADGAWNGDDGKTTYNKRHVIPFTCSGDLTYERSGSNVLTINLAYDDYSDIPGDPVSNKLVLVISYKVGDSASEYTSRLSSQQIDYGGQTINEYREVTEVDQIYGVAYDGESLVRATDASSYYGDYVTQTTNNIGTGSCEPSAPGLVDSGVLSLSLTIGAYSYDFMTEYNDIVNDCATHVSDPEETVCYNASYRFHLIDVASGTGVVELRGSRFGAIEDYSGAPGGDWEYRNGAWLLHRGRKIELLNEHNTREDVEEHGACYGWRVDYVNRSYARGPEGESLVEILYYKTDDECGPYWDQRLFDAGGADVWGPEDFRSNIGASDPGFAIIPIRALPFVE